MESVHKLKKDVQFNQELTELLDVLKGIASSQFRALQKRKERFAKFIDAFEGFFEMIDFSAAEHPFSSEKGKLGIVMITSSEGFMGGLNTRVITTALSQPGANNAELIILGERGAAYLKGMGRKYEEVPGVVGEQRYEAAIKLRDYIVKDALSEKFSRLLLVYPKPISFIVQKIEVLTILPCTELFEKREEVIAEKEHIIQESSIHGMIEYLVGTWITQKLLEVFEDSKLAEFSARTVHLEESHQSLEERGEVLRYQYFRSHHDFVDRGMREGFSAQVIRKKKNAAAKKRK